MWTYVNVLIQISHWLNTDWAWVQCRFAPRATQRQWNKCVRVCVWERANGLDEYCQFKPIVSWIPFFFSCLFFIFGRPRSFCLHCAHVKAFHWFAYLSSRHQTKMKWNKKKKRNRFRLWLWFRANNSFCAKRKKEQRNKNYKTKKEEEETERCM